MQFLHQKSIIALYQPSFYGWIFIISKLQKPFRRNSYVPVYINWCSNDNKNKTTTNKEHILFRFLLRKNLLILQDSQTIQGQKLPKYKEKNIKIIPLHSHVLNSLL